MGPGLAEEKHMLREACIGREEERRPSRPVPEVDRGTLDQEVVKNLDRGGCGGNMLWEYNCQLGNKQ